MRVSACGDSLKLVDPTLHAASEFSLAINDLTLFASEPPGSVALSCLGVLVRPRRLSKRNIESQTAQSPQVHPCPCSQFRLPFGHARHVSQ